MRTLPGGRLTRAAKPVFALALIISLAVGCAPAATPTTLPTSTLAAPTETPTMAATATEAPATPTATAAVSTPTATETPTEIITPIPLRPVVANDTLCYSGPGKDWGVVSSLQAGTNVVLMGKGGRAGWWVIQNPTYNQPCWIAEADLQINPSYDTSALQIYPVPVVTANLIPSKVLLDPSSPTCKEQFMIQVNVTNDGAGRTMSGGTILAIDHRSADGHELATATGTFPALSPGETYKAQIPMTVRKYWGEHHQLQITLDPDHQVPESNNNDNTKNIIFTLQQGSCS